MKKYRYNIIYILACVFFCCSCDNYLDIQPKGITIPRKYTDYEKMLNYAQMLKASDSYPSYMTDDAYIPNDDGELIIGYVYAERPIQNLYSFASETYGDGEDDNIWLFGYNRIYTYNVIIDDVLASEGGTEDYKLSLRAEALVGRAFEYLILINAYAKHYNKETAGTDLGVPLNLDRSINKTLDRATVQEVYDQIERDLIEAAKYLPQKPRLNTFRASKPVGYGMLARMYLYMGNYKEALKNAEESLKNKSTLLDYSVFKVDPELWIGRSDMPDGADNAENIYVRYLPYVFGVSGSVYGSEDLISLYDKDNDYRFNLYFTRYASEMDFPYDAWLPGMKANTAMATPEIYLTAAECEARIGSVDKAIHYIDQLRDMRVKDNTHLEGVITDKDEALKFILEERRRELPMLGCLRLTDLKRLNMEPNLAKTVIHVVNGQEKKLVPNDPKYVLPIPPIVLRYNPDMKPNER